MLNGISLFTGIGGLDLALEEWVKPVLYCERDRYAQAAILSRMSDGRLPIAPISTDVRELTGRMLQGMPIDIIAGGPPCQDFSLAGDGAGLEGDNGQLMFEYLRLLGELRPQYAFMENVPGLVLRGLDQVLLGFDALRYDCRWTIVSAEEVGAPFLGERLFILAKARGERHGNMDQQEPISGSEGASFARRDRKDMAMAASVGNGRGKGRPEPTQGRVSIDGEYCGELETLVPPVRAGLERAEFTKKAWDALAEHRHSGPGDWPHWLPEPALPRGHDGLSLRSHAIKCSGNAVVELQAKEAFKRLMGL